MNSVLISIQPKWCEIIASGKKTIEVRKTRPKMATPFKVYIYCTKDKNHSFCTDDGEQYTHIGNGKVIGEFVCDKIHTIRYRCGGYDCEGLTRLETDRVANASQLSLYDMRNYLSCNGGYGWHISDLVIYEKPKGLGEFKHCGVNYHYNPPITRPPQSWCYAMKGE